MMGRLFRPYIPLSVRCAVAERQMEKAVGCLPTNEFGVIFRDDPKSKLKPRLDAALFHLAKIFGCEVDELRLDHDPPLGARPKERRGLGKKTYYIPDANDPNHLSYRPHGPEHGGSHLVKTNIRGEHGQHPDRVLIKKQRRLEQGPKPKRGPKIRSPGFVSKPGAKVRWPKRKFESRSRT
jgi:hypothetical protein